jgi:hypothetical protein
MGSGQGPGQSVLEIVQDAADMRSAVGRRSHVVNGDDDDDDGKSSMVDDHSLSARRGKLAIAALLQDTSRCSQNSLDNVGGVP